jgi:tryptophanyl-tRNA synthetase
LFLSITPKPDVKTVGLNVVDMFTISFFAWLQHALGDAPLVLQIADDLAFLSQEKGKIADAQELGRLTISEVMACGLSIEQTFAFLNTEQYVNLYPALVPVQKQITFGESRDLLDISLTHNIGIPTSLAIRAVCTAPRALPEVIKAPDAVAIELCMSDSEYEHAFVAMIAKVSAGFDVARESAPGALFSAAFPPIHGESAVRMGIKAEIPAIFTADTAKKIKQKVNKYALSGGGATVEEQRENGADLTVDMTFQWLKLVLGDDEQLAQIESAYGSGEMMTGECKAELIKVIQEHVAVFVSRKAELTAERLAQATTPRVLL